jgi:photosystem II protein PsbQ
MRRYQSILAGILVLFTVFIVSCGSPAVKAPPTYSSAQIQQIQISTAKVQEMRDRMPELGETINQRKWTYVGMFIHGPLGTVREQLSRISRNLLLPEEQKAAQKAARALFDDIEAIDAAAQTEDYTRASIITPALLTLMRF